MIHDLKQLATFADFKKAAATAARAIGKNPVKILYFSKFPFGKESKPAMFLGDMPSAILTEVKKRGGSCTVGTCQVNINKLEFSITGGAFNGKAFKEFLAPLGVALPIEDKAAPSKPEVEKPLQTKELGSAYKDEDKKVGWRSQVPKTSASDIVTTKYFNEQEKKDSKVTTDAKGRMVDASGNVMANADKGFVMSPKGEIHQFDQTSEKTPDGKTKNNHHSSPLAGGKVAAAGTIATGDRGQVTKITDQSGHYKPDAELTHQVVRELGKEKDVQGFSKNLVDRRPDASGAPVNRPAKVELLGKNGLSKEEWDAAGKDVTKINKLLKEKMGAKAIQLTAPEVARLTLPLLNMKIGQGTAVTLTAQQFEQTQGNEAQIRGKAQVVDQINKNVPKTPAVSDKKPARPATAYDDVADVNGPGSKTTYDDVPDLRGPAAKKPPGNVGNVSGAGSQTTYDDVEDARRKGSKPTYGSVPGAQAPGSKTTYGNVPGSRSPGAPKTTYDDVEDARQKK